VNDHTESEIAMLRNLLVLNRIRILEVLLKDDACVCKMVEILEMKHSLMSHHLKELVDMGYLVERRFLGLAVR